MTSEVRLQESSRQVRWAQGRRLDGEPFDIGSVHVLRADGWTVCGRLPGTIKAPITDDAPRCGMCERRRHLHEETS